MEPVTLILTALTAAAPLIGKKLCDEVVVDAYKKLKDLIHHHAGTTSETAEALAKVEAAPESAGRKAVLGEELTAAGLAEKPEVLAAAQALLEQLQRQHGTGTQVHASGDRSVAIGGNVTGSMIVTGDHNNVREK